MNINKCVPKCKFDDSFVLAQRANPKYPDEKTAQYSLIGCMKCGSLSESRRGPDADRWGSAEIGEVEVDYQYAQENYGLSEAEILKKLGLR